MGQEQSYPGHTSVSQASRYKDRYGPAQYSSGPLYRPGDYDSDYKRHKPRRSGDSFKSDNSSTESSGYRSGSSTYESHSNRSSKNEYYCTSLYKNDHYKDVNNEIYRPVKIKEKKHLQLLAIEKDELKSARLKSYLAEAEKSKHTSQTQKKAGIRNYTPKILSEEEQKKKVDSWI